MTENEAIEELKTKSCYECSYGCDSPVTCSCESCAIKDAVNIAIKALEKQPQIVEISEGDLICIKTNLLLHPEVLKKVQANFVKQKESGVIVLDSRFDYTIVKMNKEDEA